MSYSDGISKVATEKARKILMGDLGEARMFVMLMNINMRSPRADYDFLKDVIITSLKQDGTMSAAEINSVDFDEFIEPFVDEVDSDDDYQMRQLKHGVMNVIKSHRI